MTPCAGSIGPRSPPWQEATLSKQKIGVLGTGDVGRVLGDGLVAPAGTR